MIYIYIYIDISYLYRKPYITVCMNHYCIKENRHFIEDPCRMGGPHPQGLIIRGIVRQFKQKYPLLVGHFLFIPQFVGSRDPHVETYFSDLGWILSFFHPCQVFRVSIFVGSCYMAIYTNTYCTDIYVNIHTCSHIYTFHSLEGRFWRTFGQAAYKDLGLPRTQSVGAPHYGNELELVDGSTFPGYQPMK